jgi:hypothetical protein
MILHVCATTHRRSSFIEYIFDTMTLPQNGHAFSAGENSNRNAGYGDTSNNAHGLP